MQGMCSQLEPVAEQWRAMGVFAPKLPVPDDAPLRHRLLGLGGPQPEEWTTR